MKKRIVFLLAMLFVLLIVWGLWFGGIKIFGTLSSLDDNGIEAFLALNFISINDVSDDRETRIQIVRDWIRQLEEKPYTEFVTARPPSKLRIRFAARFFGTTMVLVPSGNIRRK